MSIFSTMYSMPLEIRKLHNEVLDFIYHSTLLISTAFFIYPVWPKVLKNNSFMPIFWLLGLFYIIPFTGTVQVIISNFGQIQLMIFLLSLVVVSTLFRWQTSIILIIAGVFLGIKFYKEYYGVYEINSEFSTLQFKIIYLLLLVSSLLIMFLKPKQEQQEASDIQVGTLTTEVGILDGKVIFLNEKVGHLEFHAEARKDELNKAFELKNEFLRNLQHESRTPITGITSLSEVVYDCYDSLTDEQRKTYLKEIAQSSTRFNSYVDSLTDLSKLESMSYEFKPEKIDFAELVNERTRICQKLYIKDKDIGKQEFVLELEDDVIGEFDRYYISQAIDNIIVNAIQYCKQGKITINLSQTNNLIKFSVSDEGIGIPKEDLYDVFGAFTVSSLTRTPAGGRGVGLALCKKIIDLYQGVIQAVQNKGKGVTFTFALPKK